MHNSSLHKDSDSDSDIYSIVQWLFMQLHFAKLHIFSFSFVFLYKRVTGLGEEKRKKVH